jgi:nitroreductase
MAQFDLVQVERLLTTTRSVRRRLDLDRPVEPEVIRECVRLATHAPNAINAQTWRWLVITDRETRRAIGDLYREALLPIMVERRARRVEIGDADLMRHTDSILYLVEHLGEVPALVIPCIEAVEEGTGALAGMTGLLGSIYPAVWSFQLALRSRGLGSTFTTAHLLRAEAVAELLGIPDGYVQTCLLPVAYTKGTDFKPAKRRPVDEVIFWDRWGSNGIQ